MKTGCGRVVVAVSLFAASHSGFGQVVAEKQFARAEVISKGKAPTERVFSRTGGDQVSVSVEIFQKAADGSEIWMASPTGIVSGGEWITFEEVEEFVFPSRYGEPSIPAEVTPADPSVAWKTNDQSLYLPAHPAQFEDRELGRVLKLRPEIDGDGSLTIRAVLHQSALRGFSRQGTPISVEETGKLIGRKKTEFVAENAQLKPVVIERTREWLFVPDEKGRLEPREVKDTGIPKRSVGEVAVPDFAARLCHDTLPDLRLEITAETLDDKPGSVPAKEVPTNSQIFLSSRLIEFQDEILPTPIPPVEAPLHAAVFTETEMQQWIRAINQKRGVDLLSAPSMMLRSGLDGVVEVGREFAFPREFDPPKIAARSDGRVFPATPATPTEFATRTTGVRLNLQARLLQDGLIEIDLSPELAEQAGFFNFGGPVIMNEIRPGHRDRRIHITENRIELPVFHRRSLDTTVRLRSGDAVLLGGLVRVDFQDVEDKLPVLGDLPLIGRVARKQFVLQTRRQVYLLIKAEVVNAAGMPLTAK